MEHDNFVAHFKPGIFLLETLTSGMYTNPLTVLREYIQNSVDSFDLNGLSGKKNNKVRIGILPKEKTIVVRDNGTGIPAKYFGQYLSSIGISPKLGRFLRGFRGIGRLGGLAFCEEATFVTKAPNENIISTQIWDSKLLRQYLNPNNHHKTLQLETILRNVVKFSRQKTYTNGRSFFEVTLKGVKSFKNILLDMAKARNYLSAVAPLYFSKDLFTFSDQISKYLRKYKELTGYAEYNVSLNGEPLYKPFCNSLPLARDNFDLITDIRYFKLIDQDDTLLGVGWIGNRKEFLGSLKKSSLVSGIRVRCGNIQIGDENLLDKCFREPRFNSYCIGELHVNNKLLIPNSRRDDFIDNEWKSKLFNEFERTIGAPISKEIRNVSNTKNEIFSEERKTKKKDVINNLLNRLKKSCQECPKLFKVESILQAES